MHFYPADLINTHLVKTARPPWLFSQARPQCSRFQCICGLVVNDVYGGTRAGITVQGEVGAVLYATLENTSEKKALFQGENVSCSGAQ
jgi:hypothetical protein